MVLQAIRYGSSGDKSQIFSHEDLWCVSYTYNSLIIKIRLNR